MALISKIYSSSSLWMNCISDQETNKRMKAAWKRAKKQRNARRKATSKQRRPTTPLPTGEATPRR